MHLIYQALFFYTYSYFLNIYYFIICQINNAGGAILSDLDNTTGEMMVVMFQQHVKAPLQFTQLLKDKLVERKGKGA